MRPATAKRLCTSGIELRESNFLFKNYSDRFNCVAFVKTSCLKIDMCKSESSISHESRSLSTNSSEGCGKASAFNLSLKTFILNFISL